MNKRLIAFSVLAIATAGLAALQFPRPAALEDGETRVLNIAYGTASSRQRLDLYLPNEVEPAPLIVFIHGGGFRSGNKRGGNAKPVVRAALDRGYAAASIDYRLSGEATFPAAVEDVLAAIRFLRTEGTALGVSADRLATWGASAGGNLSAMAGTFGSAEDGSKPQAVINWFGPILFDRMDEQFETLGLEPVLGATNRAGSPESLYLGGTVGTAAAEPLVRQASPQSHVSPDDPPMLVQHGTADRNVPLLQSKDLAHSLSAEIGPENVVFDAIPGAGHGGDAFLTQENFDRIFEFLDRHLKGEA